MALKPQHEDKDKNRRRKRPKLTAKDDGSHDEARQPGDDKRVRPEVRAADGGVLRSHQARAKLLRRPDHRHDADDAATLLLLLLVVFYLNVAY